MTKFFVAKKHFQSFTAGFMVSRQSLELGTAASGRLVPMKKHFDFTAT